MPIVGIGVDVVEVARIRTALTRTPALLPRLFTERERTACTAQAGTLRWDRLATRFAAKEAVAKALGTGVRGFAFCDVEVVADPLGRPGIALHRGAAEVAASRGVERVHLSLSHTGSVAVADVVLESAS